MRIRIPCTILLAVGALVLGAGLQLGWWIGDHRPVNFVTVPHSTPDAILVTSWPAPTAPPPGP